MGDQSGEGDVDRGERGRKGFLGTPPGDAEPSDSGGTDHRLNGIDLEAFRRGERHAFQAVLERYGSTIAAVVATYTTDPADRKDLYQEICVRLWQNGSDYRNAGKFSGWVAKLSNNHARNWLTRRRRRDGIFEPYEPETVSTKQADTLFSDPSRVLRFNRFLDHLDGALAKLPPKQFKMFTMVCLEGRPPKAVAEELEVSVGTVRSNVRHVRAKLREQLKDPRHALS